MPSFWQVFCLIKKISHFLKKSIAKKNLLYIVRQAYGYGCVAQLARATDS